MFAEPAIASETTDPRWAWAPYRPNDKRPWNLMQAGHLYRRAAFGATWPELEQALAEGPQRTIDKLLAPTADTDTFNLEYDESVTMSFGSSSSNRPRLGGLWASSTAG